MDGWKEVESYLSGIPLYSAASGLGINLDRGRGELSENVNERKTRFHLRRP